MRVVGAIKVCGQKVRVIRCSATDPRLQGAHGISDPSGSAIYLRDDLPDQVLREVLIHELAHMISDLSGVQHFLRDHLPRIFPVARIEEAIVRMISPHLLSLIDDNPNLLRVTKRGRRA